MKLRRTVRTLAIVVFLSAVLANAQTQTAEANSKTLPNKAAMSSSPVAHHMSDDNYVIGPDDVLAINVWKEPDLSRTVPVRPDGKITLPLVGDIGASGTTPKQLQTTIQQSLSTFVSQPAVTVIVQEAKSHRFNIIGAVQKPGAYVLASPTTVLDAIALAGGFRDWAKVKDIYVLRTGANGLHTKLAFNYKKVIKGDDSAPNIELQMGDTVVVP